ncbi:hypothetical protein C8Q74DRAFT_1248211 [Fomes fomentarius]|nr:hypothetical protein C8Q74DRAFT_1248211 [Fomes fomentarius]
MHRSSTSPSVHRASSTGNSFKDPDGWTSCNVCQCDLRIPQPRDSDCISPPIACATPSQSQSQAA